MTGRMSAPTLDGFTRVVSALEGVHVRHLQPMTRLLVETRNSLYQIVVTGDGQIIVEGGAFFERPTEAVLEGASLGGSCLRAGWVSVGLRMEIRDSARRIVTSPVHRIVVDREGAPGVH